MKHNCKEVVSRAVAMVITLHLGVLPLCCWSLIWPIQNDTKKLKNDWNPGSWVFNWEYSVRAFQWIPIWHGLDGFQKSLDEGSLSIGTIKGITVKYLKPVYSWYLQQSKIIYSYLLRPKWPDCFWWCLPYKINFWKMVDLFLEATLDLLSTACAYITLWADSSLQDVYLDWW